MACGPDVPHPDVVQTLIVMSKRNPFKAFLCTESEMNYKDNHHQTPASLFLSQSPIVITPAFLKYVKPFLSSHLLRRLCVQIMAWLETLQILSLKTFTNPFEPSLTIFCYITLFYYLHGIHPFLKCLVYVFTFLASPFRL